MQLTLFIYAGFTCQSWQLVKALLENIDFIDQQAFDTDKVLLHELNHFEGFQGNPLLE